MSEFDKFAMCGCRLTQASAPVVDWRKSQMISRMENTITFGMNHKQVKVILSYR